jgi:hypothetical protein
MSDPGTYFAHDAARRMTSARQGGSAQSAYFSYDQRDWVTKAAFAKTSSPDTTHEWGYTGSGERVLMIGGQGGTTPTYLAYDGSKLLTERDENAFTYGRYRHGSYVGVEDQESGTVMTPSVDERGSVLYLADAPSGGSAVYTAFGWEVTNTLATTTRLMFVPSLLEKLNLSNLQLSMTATGLYWPLFGVGLVGAGPGWLPRIPMRRTEEDPFPERTRAKQLREFLVNLLGNDGFILRDDGDDPRDTPPPIVHGEEIDSECACTSVFSGCWIRSNRSGEANCKIGC